MIDVQIEALQKEVERLLKEGKDEEQIVLRDGAARVAELEFKREDVAGELLTLREWDVLRLPNLPALHRDPFDRMLICQAIVNGFAIVTPDPLIQQYPAKFVW